MDPLDDRAPQVEVLSHERPLPADAEPMGRPLRLRLRVPVQDGRQALRLLGAPSRLPSLHPLIDHIAEAPALRDGTRTLIDFTIHEHVPVLGGLLRLPNRYRGRVIIDSGWPDRVRTSGWSRPGIRVEALHQLLPEGVLEETLWFSGPGWLRSFLTATIREAHREQLQAVSMQSAP